MSITIVTNRSALHQEAEETVYWFYSEATGHPPELHSPAVVEGNKISFRDPYVTETEVKYFREKVMKHTYRRDEDLRITDVTFQQ